MYQKSINVAILPSKFISIITLDIAHPYLGVFNLLFECLHPNLLFSLQILCSMKPFILERKQPNLYILSNVQHSCKSN